MKSGWGLTSDGKSLIATDGGDILFYINPDTMQVEQKVRTFEIKGGSKSYQNNINELEFVGGYVWANIWGSNDIIKIDAKTGQISRRYDMSELKWFNDIERELMESRGHHWSTWEIQQNVLNGIAYNPHNDSFYLTGKKWFFVFEVKFN